MPADETGGDLPLFVQLAALVLKYFSCFQQQLSCIFIGQAFQSNRLAGRILLAILVARCQYYCPGKSTGDVLLVVHGRIVGIVER